MAGRVRKLLFERIQEFHDCYVEKSFPPDNMRKVLIVEKDFASVNQLVAFLTSVAPNWQRHSVKAGSLKKRQNTADFLGVWAKQV